MKEFVFQKDFRMINLMLLFSSDVGTYVLPTTYPQILKVLKNQMGVHKYRKNFVEGQPKGLGEGQVI